MQYPHKPGQKTAMAALVIAAILICATPVGCYDSGRRSAEKPIDFKHQREEMVTRQIEARGISDELVLAAMREVERHRFVPSDFESDAYGDYPLPIGQNQTISQPYIVGLMTALLKIDSTDRVLEIGTGSGYQAAVLAEIAAEVYSIEIIPELANRAESLLTDLGYENITVRCGDGFAGWPEQAPFDAVIVTCAPPRVPQPLIDQLADSGRLVIPVGLDYQELLLLEKTEDGIVTKRVAPVRFVPMTGDGIRKGK